MSGGTPNETAEPEVVDLGELPAGTVEVTVDIGNGAFVATEGIRDSDPE
jgi:hypothetical protein